MTEYIFISADAEDAEQSNYANDILDARVMIVDAPTYSDALETVPDKYILDGPWTLYKGEYVTSDEEIIHEGLIEEVTDIQV